MILDDLGLAVGWDSHCEASGAGIAKVTARLTANSTDAGGDTSRQYVAQNHFLRHDYGFLWPSSKRIAPGLRPAPRRWDRTLRNSRFRP